MYTMITLFGILEGVPETSGLLPKLSLLAKQSLTISCSSVSVESLFSVTGLILNGRRSSIAPYRLNMLSFVHDNYKAFC